MENLNSFKKKLKSYSIFAGSMLAMTRAEGQIVYTNLNPDVEIGGVIPTSFPYNDSYGLDLNNDGIVDFNFNLSILGHLNLVYDWSYLETISGVVTGNEILGSALGTKVQIDIASSGDSINYSGLDTGGFGNWFPGARLEWMTSNGGDHFLNNFNHLFALQFLINNEPHFAWLRLACNTRPGGSLDTINIVIRDFAYNSVANASIIAGQTTANLDCDQYEPNNDFHHPSVINIDQAIHDRINPAGDRDFFKFNVAENGTNLRIILSDLPKNYDIALFTPNHVTLGISRNLQEVNDTIIWNNASSGSYIVKVYSKNNKSDESCYSLLAEKSAIPFKMDDALDNVSPLQVSIHPNPVSSYAIISFSCLQDSRVQMELFDVEGRKIETPLNEDMAAGNHELTLASNQLDAGIYFLKVKMNDQMIIKKIIME